MLTKANELLITVWEFGLHLDPPFFIMITGRLVSKYLGFFTHLGHSRCGQLKKVLEALRMKETITSAVESPKCVACVMGLRLFTGRVHFSSLKNCLLRKKCPREILSYSKVFKKHAVYFV